jgi:hypothetical protein
VQGQMLDPNATGYGTRGVGQVLRSRTPALPLSEFGQKPNVGPSEFANSGFARVSFWFKAFGVSGQHPLG